jgi:hypothetical protein
MVVAYTNSNFHTDQNLTEYSANGDSFTTAKTFTMTVNAGTILKGFFLKYDLKCGVGEQVKIRLVGSSLGTYYSTTYTERQYSLGGYTHGETWQGWSTTDTYLTYYPGASYTTYQMHSMDPLLISTDTSLTLTILVSANQGGSYTVYMQNVYLRWY